MTFDYKFELAQDEVSFSSQPVYTYTDLKSFLSSTAVTSATPNFIREVKLCRSLGGLLIPQLNITDYSSQEVPLDCRKTVIVCARMRPGESMSSLVVQVTFEKGFRESYISSSSLLVGVNIVSCELHRASCKWSAEKADSSCDPHAECWWSDRRKQQIELCRWGDLLIERVYLTYLLKEWTYRRSYVILISPSLLRHTTWRE